MSSESEPLVKSKCKVCNVKENLRKCSRCKFILYCSQEHQKLDWTTHKAICKTIQDAQRDTDDEEARLRSIQGDWMMPDNVFENGVGHFWGYIETRDYMRARFRLVESLVKAGTYESVEGAYTHMMDLLRLCRSDNMGVRGWAPFAMLRLDKNQECYDFVKWWAKVADGGYESGDSGDTALPYMDSHGEDMFEPCKSFSGSCEFGHLVALILLKIRMLLDLQTLEAISQSISSEIPQEIIYMIREKAANTAFANRLDIIGSPDLSPHVANIRNQVEQLYQEVDAQFPDFWPILLDPQNYLNIKFEYYSRGTKEEAIMVLQLSYIAWAETPGAIEFIRQM